MIILEDTFPTCCGECPLEYRDYYYNDDMPMYSCNYGADNGAGIKPEDRGKMLPGCPLKPVDGLEERLRKIRGIGGAKAVLIMQEIENYISEDKSNEKRR